MLEDQIEQATEVVSAQRAEVLAQVHAPAVAAAVWQRSRRPGFARWIDGLATATLPSCRAVCPASRAREAAETACIEAEMPACPERRELCEDIGALARHFATIMNSPVLRLRLDVIHDDGCRRFHIDNIPARMLCTYRGRGTEYGLAAMGGIPARVARTGPGDVAIFRGLLWPGGAPCGLVHRSPPMAPGDRSRLLLVLDVAGDV